MTGPGTRQEAEPGVHISRSALACALLPWCVDTFLIANIVCVSRISRHALITCLSIGDKFPTMDLLFSPNNRPAALARYSQITYASHHDHDFRYNPTMRDTNAVILKTLRASIISSSQTQPSQNVALPSCALGYRKRRRSTDDTLINLPSEFWPTLRLHRRSAPRQSYDNPLLYNSTSFLGPPQSRRSHELVTRSPSSSLHLRLSTYLEKAP